MLDFSTGGSVRNRFNLLTSKEWLPFQKSWFMFASEGEMFKSNIRFFTKSDESVSNVFFDGFSPSKGKEIIELEDLTCVNISASNISFAYLDLRKQLDKVENEQDYLEFTNLLISKVNKIFDKLDDRRFICVIVKNQFVGKNYVPFAWDLGKIIGSIFSLKDEKIACIPSDKQKKSQSSRLQGDDYFYCLYFRKDELSPRSIGSEIAQSSLNWQNEVETKKGVPGWFILKPPPRKKDEILHPAKYPEELVDMFVQNYTEENANIYDPMSGTGSTQIGALRNARNGFGMELSPFFANIANTRCEELINPNQESLFESKIESIFKIVNDDSRNFGKHKFPKMDYLLTSPPYWDMLNMKGAENQAKRIEKGLQTNYSEDENDLGNIADYITFIEALCKIYFEHVKIFKSDAFMTIVVKNIKKKGSNYPFAWDLALMLQDKFLLLPENFWLQDDISIAPFGYGYTWVSNTFHQYCLNFQLRSS